MQPYFFPYYEYFRLIDACDLWIIFDTVRYNPSSWMSRNRVLNNSKPFSYISVPITKKDHHLPINRATIANRLNWRKAIFDKLDIYRRFSPFFTETMAFLESCLDDNAENLARFNASCIRHTCDALAIDTEIKVFSEMNLDIPPIQKSGDWALEIAAAVSATEYRNASGGRALYIPTNFKRRGISLSFHQPVPLSYDTGPLSFQPDLSILDTFFWLGRQKTAAFIKNSRDGG